MKNRFNNTLNFWEIYDQIIENGLDDKETPIDMFELASDICLKEVNKKIQKEVILKFSNFSSSDMTERVEEFFRANMDAFIEKCNGIALYGRWKCGMGFTKILTRNGVCMTFNMLSRSELVRENM